MSDTSSQTRRLPVWRTVKAAYLVIFHNPGLAIKLAIIPTIFFIIQNILVAYFWGGMTRAQMSVSVKEDVGLLVLEGVVLSISILAAFPMITAWHRMVILGCADPDSRIHYSIKKPEWLYLLKAILFGLMIVPAFLLLVILGVIVLALASVSDASLMANVLTTIFILISATIISRLGLVFPAAAIGKPIGFGESWLKSKGNTWRLFAAVCLGFIPSFIIFIVLDRLITGYWVFNIKSAVMPTMPMWIVSTVLNVPFSQIGLCVGVSVWSWAYRYLYQEQPITLPGES